MTMIKDDIKDQGLGFLPPDPQGSGLAGLVASLGSPSDAQPASQLV